MLLLGKSCLLALHMDSLSLQTPRLESLWVFLTFYFDIFRLLY